jgi:hypothetical protein
VENFVDLYTDYLLMATGQVTATGLSQLLDGAISHDKITRALYEGRYDSKYLWQKVKPIAEEICHSSETVILSFDDSIQEKRYSDQSELICWHYDHVFNRNVKGVNFLTALLEVGGMRLPCAVEFVRKDIWKADPKTGKEKRTSSRTKNEMFREMVGRCTSQMKIDYVLADSWYSSAENMRMLKQECGVDFILALKSNRKAALSLKDKQSGKYISIGALQLGQQAVEVWFEELDFPLLLTKQVFKDGDGTVGELYLACSDLNLSYEQISTIYKKRWGVEEYHKSVKSNGSFAQSPTHTVRTQSNHFMLAILAYVKLEWLKQRHSKNHFALKQKIYQAALKGAYTELRKLSTPLEAMAA